HQYLYQLEPDIRYAVLGNAGTLLSFRLGPEDAAFFAKEFQPKFHTEDLLNLPNHHIYLRLMIDGAPSKPFSATTLLPLEQQQRVRRLTCVSNSRGFYYLNSVIPARWGSGVGRVPGSGVRAVDK